MLEQDVAEALAARVRAGLLFASLPIAALGYGALDWAKQRDLQARQQAHELALSAQEREHAQREGSIARALDLQQTPAQRQVVLRYLYAGARDPLFRAWAEAELGALQLELDAREALVLRDDAGAPVAASALSDH